MFQHVTGRDFSAYQWVCHTSKQTSPHIIFGCVLLVVLVDKCSQSVPPNDVFEARGNLVTTRAFTEAIFQKKFDCFKCCFYVACI